MANKFYFVDKRNINVPLLYDTLNGEDKDLFKLFSDSDYLAEYKFPLAIDFFKTKDLYKKSGNLNDSIKYSRINIMGTDGIRGKVSLDYYLNPLETFFKENIISPQLIELVASGFCRMLINNKILGSSEKSIIGNDGRDVVTNWMLKKHLILGFNKEGIDTIDIGITPTPFVPFTTLYNGFTTGGMLTASHNPANQNGVKFFLNGSKLLPEGLNGDYTLTYWVFDSLINSKIITKKGINKEISFIGQYLKFLKSNIPSDFHNLLKSSFLYVDSANGAFYTMISDVLNGLNVKYKHLDSTPVGANINHCCGVSEIEGKEIFLSDDYNSSTTIVKSIFDHGRNKTDNVFGMVLDGDGDRGFVLLYDKETDSVLNLDGDKCGYLIAKYFVDINNITGENFVTTVESDIMTAYSAHKYLKLETPIVSVGDKWISNFNNGKLLLGLESSGHLILPIEFTNKNNQKVELRSGNGLLTTILTIYAIKQMGLTVKDSFLPYKPGFSKTFYIYNVNKSLFSRGSKIWEMDKKLLIKEFENNSKLKEYSYQFQDKEDLQMLYLSIYQNDTQVGTVFCRNSGTEDKSAIYIKCKDDLSGILLSIGIKLRDFHITNLKNINKLEFKYEEKIIEILKLHNKIATKKLREIFLDHISISEADFNSLIYGLKKEERIIIEDSFIELK